MKTANHRYSDFTNVKKNTRPIQLSGIYSMFEARYNPDFYFDGECHSPWEMVYVIDGNAGVTADDRVYSLKTGDIIFHKPMEFHKIWSESGNHAHVFTCSFFLDGTLTHKLQNGVFRLWDEPVAVLNSIIGRLHQNIPLNENTQNVNFFNLLKESDMLTQLIISELETLMLMLASSPQNTLPADKSEKVRLYTQIVNLLESRVFSKITISEIAEFCSVSSATVKNCFADYAGCGIHKYFLKIKMRTAIELLRQGKNVSEVSDMLQFANPNYFSFVFKRETGLCASSYKE